MNLLQYRQYIVGLRREQSEDLRTSTAQRSPSGSAENQPTTIQWSEYLSLAKTMDDTAQAFLKAWRSQYVAVVGNLDCVSARDRWLVLAN
jgi:hypothetical protein